ncbi:MAG: helix-turn-helix domain-containing protein [Alphaproteobacteria bacterium]|nr:helix-turn-helix domain-containing protein [Alphaproteobacteria bacterium]
MTKVTRLTLDDEGGLDRRRIHLREISGDLDSPLDAVGQDLRAARLRRGDDLATVSRALKIRKDHLEALEEDRIDALPGRTYAIGFIRSYADYLGLDAVQCVERFKAEISGRTDDHMPTITVIDEDDNRRMPQGWKIIAGVILVLVIYGAYQLAAQADRAFNEQATPAPIVAVHPVSHVRLSPAPKAPGTAPLTGVAVPSQTAVPPPAATTSQLSATGAPASAAPPTAAQQPPPLPQGQVYGAGNKNARVVLRMHQAARILVQGPDGRVLMNRTLKPGDTLQLPNLVGLTLTTSNAGAVELDLDGQSVGVVGRDQETTEALPLDPQAIMDRYNSGRGR